MAGTAFRRKFFDQLFEGDILIAEGLESRFTGFFQNLDEGRVALELMAQGAGC